MNNVKMSLKGNKLTITMDIAKFSNRELTADDLSSTGKSYVIAGSNGFQKREGDKLEGLNLSLNLNTSRKCYDPRQALIDGRQEAREALAESKAQQASTTAPNGLDTATLD